MLGLKGPSIPLRQSLALSPKPLGHLSGQPSLFSALPVSGTLFLGLGAGEAVSDTSHSFGNTWQESSISDTDLGLQCQAKRKCSPTPTMKLVPMLKKWETETVRQRPQMRPRSL